MDLLNTLVWTFLLVLLTGLFVLGMEWTIASMIHAPKLLEYGLEGLTLVGLAYLFRVVFKQAYKAETSNLN